MSKYTASDFTHFTLPAYWASALINGDYSGLTDDDEKELEKTLKALGVTSGQCTGCSEEPEFRKYHDAQPYGVLASDCLDYCFLINRKG